MELTDPISIALKTIADGSMENDRLLLKVCTQLTDKVLNLEKNLESVRNRVVALTDKVIEQQDQIASLLALVQHHNDPNILH